MNLSQDRVLCAKLHIVTGKITNCHTCDEVDISGPFMSVLLKIISIYINLTYLE